MSKRAAKLLGVAGICAVALFIAAFFCIQVGDGASASRDTQTQNTDSATVQSMQATLNNTEETETSLFLSGISENQIFQISQTELALRAEDSVMSGVYAGLTKSDIAGVTGALAGKDYDAHEILLLFAESADYDEATTVMEELELSADEADLKEALANNTMVTATIIGSATVEDTLDAVMDRDEICYAQPNYIYYLCDEETEEDFAVTSVATSVTTSAAASATTSTATTGDLFVNTSALTVSPFATLNDTYASQLWHLDPINAYDAWDLQTGDHNAAVAVIDTGADADHPDLVDNIVAGYNAVDRNTNYDDIDEHGSHVCGIVAAEANNNLGVAGVSYNSYVIPVMTGRSYYYPIYGWTVGFYSSDIATAYQYLLTDADNNGIPDLTEEYGLHVINMSLGGEWDTTSSDDRAVEKCIDEAYDNNIITVCASGNDNQNDNNGRNKEWPADYEKCVSVIALEQSGNSVTRAYYSNYGSCKDISAPGSSIYSTIPDKTYKSISGTSMASPVVAGGLSLLFAKNPSLTSEEAIEIMEHTATDLGDTGYDIYYAWGCINFAAALEATPDFTTVAIPEAPEAVTYNGQAQTAQIAVDERYTIEGATQVNAGTYEIIISLIDQEKYEWEDGTTDDIVYTWEILKADPTYTVPVFATDYGGSLDDIALPIGFTWQDISRINFGAVGTYEAVLTYTPDDTDNYNIITDISSSVIVRALVVDLVWSGNETRTYDGQPSAVNAHAVGVLDGDECEVEVIGGDAVHAGEYVASATALSNDNYELSGDMQCTYVIEKAPVSIVVNDATKFIGDADPELTGTVYGLIDADDLGKITYVRASGEESGTYAITANYTPNDDYDITVTDGMFTIVFRTLEEADFVVDTSSVPYTGFPITKDIASDLTEDDYEVVYTDNINAGVATITITGKGLYAGNLVYHFTIDKVFESLGGADRYETASLIASAELDEADTVILACGSNFPDALAAAPYAGIKNAPVLLTPTGELSGEVLEEIERLGAQNVVVVGGAGSVSAEVSLELGHAGLSVRRLAGDTRYETAVKIYENGRGSWSNTAIIASGETFADALSISAYANASASPIFLASKDGLDEATVAAIEGGGFERIVIVGGVSSVPASVEQWAYSVASTVRLAGQDRYETSALIASWELEEGMSCNFSAVASGSNFPDALAGGVLCGSKSSVLVLMDTNDGLDALEVLSANKETISYMYFLGGENSLSSELTKLVKDTLS